MGFLRWLMEQEQPLELRTDYPLLSVSDPAVLDYFGVGYSALPSVSVTEQSVLGVPGVYRAVSIISGTIADLPLKTYRDVNGSRNQVSSFLDNPGLDMHTPFEWKELTLVHLLIHGNAFFLKVFNGGGALVGLQPVHPSLVSVAYDKKMERKVYKISYEGKERVYTDETALHIPALGTDGLVGLAPLTLHRMTFATTIAGNEATGNMFGNGLLIPGMITSEDAKFTSEEARIVKEDVESRMTGHKNAGKVPVVNRNLKFIPMTQVSRDAQFLESRAFQIEEIARIYGVPPHLLAQTEKQTSWGTGVQEQNLGLARYTFRPWTSRIEDRLSRLLPRPQFCEFLYKGLLAGTPQQEIELLILQKDAGILTLDEIRAIMNLPPLTEPDPVTEVDNET